MRRTTRGTVAGVIAITLAAGCNMNRRPGMCALVGGVLGAGAGGATAGVLRYNTADHKPSNGTEAIVTAGGTVAGGLVGAILGHFICDPIKEPVAQAAPAETPPPSGTQIAHLEGTNFAFDSAKLTPAGEAILDEAIAAMTKHQGITVRIEGNTDAIGSDAYNMKLGQRRADAVEGYLVAHGIAASRLSTVSYGKTRPIASNDTEEGRAKNRRVDLVVE